MPINRAPRGLNAVDRMYIRNQIALGVARAQIARDLRVSLNQVDAIRAHLTMAEQRQVREDVQMLNRAYMYAARRAKELGRNCLTKDECRSLWNRQGGRCAISGRPFSEKRVNAKAKVLSRPWRPSLDRINPRRGYEASNVRLVAQIVNFAMGEWPFPSFLEMCCWVTAEQMSTIVAQGRLRTALKRSKVQTA